MKKFKEVLKRLKYAGDSTCQSNVVRNIDDFSNLTDGNAFIGDYPQMKNSVISFRGNDNVFFCEPGVELVDCNLEFNGNNSLVYLCRNIHKYYLSISANNNNVCYIGRNNYFNGTMHIILSEHKHFFVGNDCFFSFGIWVRNADPHLIYNSINGKRRNPTRSIFVGDHVWIGQSVMLLKGTRIDSGSIIGAMSVASGTVSHNSVYRGNPLQKMGDSVFWDGASVHKWNQEDTDRSQTYSQFIEGKNIHKDDYIFEYDKEATLPYETLDNVFDGTVVKSKLDYLGELNHMNKKNRFVHRF